jgi:D-threo-aldose 1-dehydrogenase
MTPEPLEARPLGRTGLMVTPLCIGTSPLASMPALYGYDVTEQRAIDTVHAVFDSPINFIDTSNGYGADGSAERRIGAAIAQRGGLPSGTVLATKVDPDPTTGDFSGDRVRASFEESLERLGVDHIPLLHLHDPERITFDQAMAKNGPVEALVSLREQGLVDNLGVAGGPVGLLREFLDTGVFDVLLTHNRFTLLDRSAKALCRDAHDRGIGVLNAAPYGGGMLARGPKAQPKYGYGLPGDAITAAAAAMAAACEAVGVSLPTAALQFSMRAPFVASTLVGVSSPARVLETVELAMAPLPDSLWADLDRLAPPASDWIDPPTLT